MHPMRCLAVAGALLFAACTGRAPTAPAEPPRPPADGAPVQAIFLTPNTWTLPLGGGSLDIVIVTAGNTAGNVIAAHAHVTLTASSGTLSASEIETDGTGHAQVTWSGTRSATVRATAGELAADAAIRVTEDTTPPPPNPPPGPPGPPVPPPGADAPLVVSIQPGSDPPLRADTVLRFIGIVTDPYGRQVSGVQYDWDFNGDGAVDTREGPSASYRYAQPGDYVIALHAVAADGRSGRATLRIGVALPPLLVRVTATPNPVAANALVTITATVSGPAPVSMQWDLDGDGIIDLDNVQGSTLRRYPAGVYTVLVTVQSADGQTTTGSVTLTVQ